MIYYGNLALINAIYRETSATSTGRTETRAERTVTSQLRVHVRKSTQSLHTERLLSKRCLFIMYKYIYIVIFKDLNKISVTYNVHLKNAPLNK